MRLESLIFTGFFIASCTMVAMNSNSSKHNQSLGSIAGQYYTTTVKDHARQIGRDVEDGPGKDLVNTLSEVGIFLSIVNALNSFFCINQEAILKYPKDLAILYNFLKDNNFITNIGFLSAKKLLNEKSKINRIEEFHKKIRLHYHAMKIDIDIDADTTNSIKTAAILESDKGYLFHEKQSGILFRNINNQTNHDYPDNLRDLFTANTELKELLNEAKKVNQALIDEFEALQKILADKIFKNGPNKAENIKTIPLDKKDAIEAIDAILLHPGLPRVMKELFKRHKNLGNDSAEAIRNTIHNLNYNLAVLKERRDSLSYIIPAPIDIFLLYVMHVLDNSRKDLFGKKMMAFIEAYEDNDEYSVIQLLAEPAHQVMEQLGIKLHHDLEQDSPPPSKQAQKKPKKAKKPANKGSSKTKTKKTEVSPEKLPVHKELFVDKEQDEDDEEEEILVTKMREDPVLIKPAGSLDVKPTTHPQKNLIYSLNDQTNKWMLSLELTQGMRMLDRLARLLAQDLCLDNHNAGSISLVMIPNKNHMIIATKNNRANPHILVVLKEIVKKAEELDITTAKEDIVAIKQKIHTMWQAADEEKTFWSLRYDLDIKKLALILKKDTKPDVLMQSLRKLLKNINEKDIDILENPFDLHSEQIIASYLRTLKGEKKLGIAKSLDGDVPYQYIGGSILNCKQCDTILRGRDDIIGLNRAPKVEMVFFSRGFFDGLYPGYVAPAHACTINNVKASALQKRLKMLAGETLRRDHKNSKALIKMTNCPLSDSDSE